MTRTRLKPDKRSAAMLAAVLVGLVAGGGGLLYEQQSSLASEVKQLQDAQKQRDESARVASRLADTELRYKQDNNRLKFLEASLPHMEYVPTLLKQIEQLCRDTHNEVRSVRPDAQPAKPVRPADRRTDPEAQQNGDDPNKPQEKPKPPDPYDRLQIQVALTGGFQEYQNFLQRLTQFPKIVAVDRVQLRPHASSDHSSSAPQLDVDMQLTAFIAKDAPPLPVTASTAAAQPVGAAAAAVPAAPAPSRQLSLRPEPLQSSPLTAGARGTGQYAAVPGTRPARGA